MVAASRLPTVGLLGWAVGRPEDRLRLLWVAGCASLAASEGQLAV